MSKGKAFTLIELLVVIAIIALLMGILMPALALVKSQVKDLIDRSNLRQWGYIFWMYTEDNERFFMGSARNEGEDWLPPLLPYFNDVKILLCPKAKKIRYESDLPIFRAWTCNINGRTFYGSYGVNGWLANSETGDGRPVENYWKTTNIRKADTVPMILDSAIADGIPFDDDEPPKHEDDVQLGNVGLRDEMRRFCVNRHDENIHGAFVDLSVRKIGLKELWKLKWHQEFDTNGEFTGDYDWANSPYSWMTKFEDY